MDLIREHLIYKDVPITICMGELKPNEQYELVRCLLATRTNDVSICTHHSSNNEYMTQLLNKLPVAFVQCFRNQRGTFLPPTGASSTEGGSS